MMTSSPPAPPGTNDQLSPIPSSRPIENYTPPGSTPTASSHRAEPEEVPQTPLGQIALEVRQALTTDEWPVLTPGVDQLDRSSWAPEWAVDECLDVTASKLEGCLYGDASAPMKAVVLGDSVSISWMPAIRAALEPAGYSIQSLTKGQCPAASLEMTGTGKDDSFVSECQDHNAWVIDQLGAMSPDLVIVSSAANTLARMISDASERARGDEFEAALTDELTAAVATGARVVVLPPNPRGKGLVDCYTAISTPSACISSPDDQYRTFTAAMRNAAAETGAEYLDNLAWFCQSNACPGFIADIPVTVEGTHLTARMSSHLAPALRAALLDSP